MYSLVCCAVFCLCILQTFGFPTENSFGQIYFEDTRRSDSVISTEQTNISRDYELKTTELNENTDEVTERWTSDQHPYDGGTTQNEQLTELDISGNLVQTDKEKQRSKGLKYGSYEEGADQISEDNTDLFSDRNNEDVKFSDNIKIESSTASVISRISDYDEFEDFCGEVEEESNSVSVIKTETTQNVNEEFNRLEEINSEGVSTESNAKQNNIRLEKQNPSDPNLVSVIHTIPSGFNENSEVLSTENESADKLEEQHLVSSPDKVSFGFHINPTTTSSSSLENIATGSAKLSESSLVPFLHTIPSSFNGRPNIISADTTDRLENQTSVSSLGEFTSDYGQKQTIITTDDSEVPSETEGLQEEHITARLQEQTAISSVGGFTSDYAQKHTVITTDNSEVPTASEGVQEHITARSQEQTPVSSLPGFTSDYAQKHTIITTDDSEVPSETEGLQEEHITARLQEQTAISSVGGFTSDYAQKHTIITTDNSEVPTASEGVQEHITARSQEQTPVSSLAGFTSDYAQKHTVITTDDSEVPSETEGLQEEHITARLQEQTAVSSVGGFTSDYAQKHTIITTDNSEVPTASEGVQEHITTRLQEQTPVSSVGGFTSDYGTKQTVITADNSKSTGGQTDITKKLQEQNALTFVERNPSGFSIKQTSNLEPFPKITASDFNIKQPVTISEDLGITATKISPRLEEINSAPVATPSGFNAVPAIETTTAGNTGVIFTENEYRKSGARLGKPNPISNSESSPSGFDSTQTILSSLQGTFAESVEKQEGVPAEITEPAVFSFTPTGFKDTNFIENNGATSSSVADIGSTTKTYTKEPTLITFPGAIPSSTNPSPTIPSALQEKFVTYNGGFPYSISVEPPTNNLDLRGDVTNRFKELTTQQYGTVYYPTVPTTDAEYLKNSIASDNFKGGLSDSFYKPTVAPTNIPNGNLHGQFRLDGPINGIFNEQITGFNRNGVSQVTTPVSNADYWKNPNFKGVNPVSFIESTYRPSVVHTTIPSGLTNGFATFNEQNKYGDLNNNQFKFNLKTTTPGFPISGLTESNLVTTTENVPPLSTTAKTSTSFDLNPSRQYDIFTGIQTTPPPIEITSVPALKSSPAVIAPNPSIELYSRVGDQETTIPFMPRGKVTLPYEILPPKEDTRVESTTQGLIKALFSGQINFDPASSSNKGFQFQSVVGGFNLGVLTTGTGSKPRPPAPERALVPKLVYKKVKDTNFSQGIIDKYTSSNLKINTVNLGSTGSINRFGDNKRTVFNGFNIYNPSFAKFLK